ncbi:Hypothetical predicted protein [Octopus vulgaris]|uniref:Uncharacterized protein n=1 Tax=Octopus vulgaris TaxID=6645 RepID=A0AA36BRD6_OCTVU|nr:Hypothetical predicted protein [Octopus vulgaris]
MSSIADVSELVAASRSFDRSFRFAKAKSPKVSKGLPNADVNSIGCGGGGDGSVTAGVNSGGDGGAAECNCRSKCTGRINYVASPFPLRNTKIPDLFCSRP